MRSRKKIEERTKYLHHSPDDHLLIYQMLQLEILLDIRSLLNKGRENYGK